MANMFDYLKWRGDLSFTQSSFNKIDALIFAQLSYTNLEGLVSSDFSKQISLKELSKNYLESDDFESKRNTIYYKRKRTTDLLTAAGNCHRFEKVQICGLKQIIDEEKNEQFSAMVFLVDGTPFIAFTGTDDTVVGWKEDFLLSCSPNIPSHKDALDYFNAVINHFNVPVMMAGHSKGGNIAVNTAVNCNPESQKMIKAVFNFDGPGFSEAFFNSKAFKNVESRINSVYPVESIVGMIFYHQKNFEITKSGSKSLGQHRAHMWEVCGTDFVHETEFTQQSKIFHESLNTWVEQVKPKDMAILESNLFQIIDASGAKTITELSHIKIKSLQNMVSAFSKVKKTQKDHLLKYIKIVSEVAQDSSPFINAIKNFAPRKDKE